MRRKSALLFIILALFAVTASSLDFTQTTKVQYGESEKIDDYEIEFGEREGEVNLRIGRWTDTSFRVMEEFEGSEVYERDGETIEVSENLTVKIDDVGFDESGRFVELEISSTENIFSSGDLSSSSPENLIISQGESSDIPLTLENEGLVNQSFDLGYSSNSSIKASFSFQDFNVTDVYVPAGEKNSLTAEIEVPENAELGTYELDLTAEAGTKLSESFQIEIRGRELEKDISVDLEQRFDQVESGETVEIPISVINGGTGFIRPGDSGGPTLNNVEFDVGVPDGWDYELQPEGFSTLDYRDREQVRMIFDVPESAETGDYFLDISASSDDASTEESEEVRINVQEKSQMGIVGAFLMVFSLGLLVFVYRKFGRR